MTSLRARFGIASGGWVQVPEFSDDGERGRWAAAVADAVARAHGDRFESEARPLIERMVDGIAADRDASDVGLLIFLPTRGLVASTVRISMVRPEAVERWRNAGFALRPIRTEGVGEGMLATRTTSGGESDARLTAHECAFVFARDDLCIAVSVPPVDPVLFERMQPGLTDIVHSLVVEDEEGQRFAGRRVDGLLGESDDAWHIEMHDAA